MNRPPYISDCMTMSYVYSARFGTLNADESAELAAAAAVMRIDPAGGMRVLLRIEAGPAAIAMEDLTVIGLRAGEPLVVDAEEGVVTVTEYAASHALPVTVAYYHQDDRRQWGDEILSGAAYAAQSVTDQVGQ